MYKSMLDFVKDRLEFSGGEDCSKVGKFPFRKRSEHIWRVFLWTKRLMSEVDNINKEAVLVSAIFHDVGYGIDKDNSHHAENSAKICKDYLIENGFSIEFVDIVTYLIRNHSKKDLMYIKDTPKELIILMEADLLDETGALAIVWDCMMEGSEQIQSFEKTYEHIKNFSDKIMRTNPMVTAKAKEFWKEKQKLTKEFIKHLSFDLGIA
ncbi:HD domain-containing protein [Proteiniborus sp. MB09-C3]|uniref:HD domain-containing protein n=1 Tax=Proteiniborus sp. MB09-C3 TaxID=3050072 RepID=UPI00255372F0|nr:HD domain-containing protein [Proteiniborus sp. MB09-C3]WIV11532.1 HD domain-containing protein [Proteiniborus sp. MB09-C3]